MVAQFNEGHDAEPVGETHHRDIVVAEGIAVHIWVFGWHNDHRAPGAPCLHEGLDVAIVLLLGMAKDGVGASLVVGISPSVGLVKAVPSDEGLQTGHDHEVRVFLHILGQGSGLVIVYIGSSPTRSVKDLFQPWSLRGLNAVRVRDWHWGSFGIVIWLRDTIRAEVNCRGS